MCERDYYKPATFHNQQLTDIWFLVTHSYRRALEMRSIASQEFHRKMRLSEPEGRVSLDKHLPNTKIAKVLGTAAVKANSLRVAVK